MPGPYAVSCARGVFAIGLWFVLMMSIGMPAKAGREEVDVALVIAVDISYSMDLEEQTLQRQGYVEALQSPEVLNAIRQGMIGRIAVTYFEWANFNDQRIIVPWSILDGPASARAIADRIASLPPRRAQRTSISGAIHFGQKLLEESPYTGIRKVLDISGDGPNNSGPSVEKARDTALGAGVIINGLPIMVKPPGAGWGDIADLDLYYQNCVIGGPGSFVITIRSKDQFTAATKQKILREVAELGVADIIPVQTGGQGPDCFIGERMFRERWGN